MGYWVLVIVVGYLFQRLLNFLGLPSDEEGRENAKEIYEDVHMMLQFAFIQGFFTNIHDKKRFAWLIDFRHQWYFYVVYIATIPIFGLIGEIKFMQFTFSDFKDWGAQQYILGIGSSLLLLSMAAWHLWYAARVYRSVATYSIYIGSRLAIIVFYAIFSVVVVEKSAYKNLHIHHYFIGWAVSLFPEFQHPISAVVLGITMGIFVQGVGAYKFAPIYYRTS